MARLFIVIGFSDQKPTAEPFAVYIGRSGDEKRAAMEASTAVRFLVIDNPMGIRKNNSKRADNVAAEKVAGDIRSPGEKEDAPERERRQPHEPAVEDETAAPSRPAGRRRS